MLFTNQQLLRGALYPRAFILVGLGAALGALSRWWLLALIPPAGNLPLATLSANLLGTFVLAFHIRLWVDTLRFSWIPSARLLVNTGFCGGLTTYSTFAIEMLRTQASAGTIAALGYLTITLGGGLVCAAGGWFGGKWVKETYLGWERTHHRSAPGDPDDPTPARHTS
ncbi:MAG: CrcB family protein [Bowdeniella nasicola]|nr:CrcB family protein [Bowdeniella nasicola]